MDKNKNNNNNTRTKQFMHDQCESTTDVLATGELSVWSGMCACVIERKREREL